MVSVLIVLIALALIAFILWWFFGNHEASTAQAEIHDGIQEAVISVNGGYNPAVLTLKKGISARVTFNRKDPSSCLDHVVFPDFGINDFLPQNEDHVIELETSKDGEINYACGMNMFHGKIIVK
ncbi:MULTISPECIES: cupredoxin domain-containing protein [unclassified Lactococcus]|uniref:cupredoxin domain-containing protein n=1 Tax=unclassified Lactococcus TaxID=2643510 RepID=UPI0011CBDE6C|nr:MULTISPECIES: cupredoxin domain-containing protein [unclassified Lactococcus]MQW23084.1 cupredoxin domain-containing protein [Lactococcus sp. dk101]TXK44429.1 cupredoxin domain-containing protein [Lactococcus sp. dk310]TXK50239.1 cupredoxin domain-containing protein [Lactococcus sp. dk322]